MLMISVLWALFQLPRVQTYAAQKLTSYLSDELETTITIEKLEIGFWNKLELNKFYLEDQLGDTLLYVEALELGINFLSFDQRALTVDLFINNGKASFIREEGKDDYKHDFLINYFTSEQSVDSSKEKKWTLKVEHLKVKNSAFTYHDFNKPQNQNAFDLHHIKLNDVGMKVVDFDVNDGFKAVVKELKFKEKGGFQLVQLESGIRINDGKIQLEKLEIQTPLTNLEGDIILDANSFNDYDDFITEVEMNADIQQSLIDFKDLAYFVPELKGIDKRVYLDGILEGTVDNLKGEKIEIQFGKSSYLMGDFTMRGLPDIENTFIFLSVEELKTIAQDIRELPRPPFEKQNYFNVPKQFDDFGALYFNGNYTGYISDFVAYGKFQSSLGEINTDVILKQNKKGNYSYEGTVSTTSFDVGSLFNIKNLGYTSFDLHMDGVGLTKEEISAEAIGKINTLSYKGYNYENIKLNANFDDETFTGSFSVDDKNLALSFSGEIDVDERTPISKFELNVKDAKLSNLNLLNKKDSLISLSFNSVVDLEGKDIDNFSGRALFEQLEYKSSKLDHQIATFELLASEDSVGRKISLNSSLLDGELKGDFKFKEFKAIYKMLLSAYIPNSSYTDYAVSDQKFDFQFNVKKSKALTEILFPALRVDSGTVLNGAVNTVEKSTQLELTGTGIQYKDFSLDSSYLRMDAFSDSLELSFRSNKTKLPGLKEIKTLNFNSFLGKGEGSSKVEWESIGKNVGKGVLAFDQKLSSLSSMSFATSESYTYINDSLWEVSEGNKIQIDSNTINIEDLSIGNNSQRIKLDGPISDEINDTLGIELNNLDLEFISSLLPENSVILSGIANGKADAVAVSGDFSMTTDLLLDKLFINNIEIGKSSMLSRWDPKRKALIVNGNLGEKNAKLLTLEGEVYPLRKDSSLALELNFNEFPIKLIAPYVEDYLSEVDGVVNGAVTIEGVASEPLLNGTLGLEGAKIKVDYLNTYYTINDEIFITPEFVGFNLIEIEDSQGSKAIATGTVFHNNYTSFNYDIGLEFENFFSLDTKSSDNDLYFGQAITTGSGNISGYADQLIIELDLKAEKGTDFKIPLGEGVDVSNSDFIIFTNSPDYKKDAVSKLDLSGIQLYFDLDITPEAKMQIIFDEQIGDIIKAQGQGNLKLEINTIGDFNIYGQYVVERGDYLFTLKNILNKKFDLGEGSTIYWDGNPYQAVLDMQAIYNLRAPLFDLFPEDSTSGFKRRIPVELELQLSNYLLNPDIGFDIRLPTADENTKRRLESILYVNNNDVNRQEMNQQVFGLLVLNRFMPSASSAAAAENYSRGAPGINNGYEFISNQLSNWFSRISDQFDVGFKYRPADELNSNEVDVSLSTQILNDRLSLDGNVGYTGQSTQYENQYSGFIGEFTAEYKLSRDGRYRIKGFNRSVSNGLLQLNSPYTQGVGLFYREEFDTIGELWKKYFKTNSK